MTKQYLIIYESNEGDIFKKIYPCFESKKEALAYFKEHNPRYKVLAIRSMTSNNKYL